MPTPLTLDTALNTASSARSVGELRTALRSLISLQDQVGESGSQSFRELQQAINDTEGRIGDLNDGFNTLRGSGVERLNGSLGLLREGFETADPGKLKIAIQGLGAAMKAVPIFLLIEGFRLLYENFDKVVEFFTGSSKAAEQMTVAIKLQEEALNNLNSAYSRELILFKEAGASEERLNKIAIAQGEDNIKSLNAQRNAVIGLMQARDQASEEGKKAAEEDYDKIVALEKAIFDATTNTGALYLKADQIRENDRRKIAELRLQNIVNEEEKELATIRERNKQEQYDFKDNVAVLTQLNINYYKELDAIRKKYGAERAGNFNTQLANEQAYDEALNAAKLADEAVLQEKRLKAIKEEIDFERALRQGAAEEDAATAANIATKQSIARKNAQAFLLADLQKSSKELQDELRRQRDEALNNEALNAQQRIKIIQDAENAIFQIKVKEAARQLALAQQYGNALNSINQLISNNENYRIQQDQYAKDAALQNDSNRTQEAIAREQARTAELLNNDQLTQAERERIVYDSETKKLGIEQNSKNAQLKLNQDFEKKATEIRKQQFERNKKIQLLTAAINAAAAVVAALGSGPPPVSIPLAIAAGAAGAAQIAIIAAQKFDDGGAGARAAVTPIANIDTRGGVPSSGSGGAGGGIPNANANGFQFDPTKIQNAQGNANTRVYVLESDISSVQNKVNVIESRANFG